jgi:hypothetical protein
MQAILILVVLFISYLVGRATLKAMGVIMFGSLASIIIKPMVWGFFILMFGIGLLGLLLKCLIACAPVIIIVVLIMIIINMCRKR